MTQKMKWATTDHIESENDEENEEAIFEVMESEEDEDQNGYSATMNVQTIGKDDQKLSSTHALTIVPEKTCRGERGTIRQE